MRCSCRPSSRYQQQRAGSDDRTADKPRYATSETLDAIEQLPDAFREKVCNSTSWPIGPLDEDEDFCFATLRHEADALAAESSKSDSAATPAAEAEGAAVRGGLGANLIATLSAVASPVLADASRTPEQVEAHVRP